MVQNPIRRITVAVMRNTVGGALFRRLLPLLVGGPLIMGLLVFTGERMKLYGQGYDEGLLATAGILTLLWIGWRQSRKLDEDMGRQKAMEERLRRAEKMEVVGTLAAGVAHDFNNLLAGIMTYGELLAQTLEEDDPRRKLVEQIVAAGDNAAALTQELLALGCKHKAEPQTVNLNEVVLDVQMLVRALVGNDIELQLSLSPQLPLTRIDPPQMQRALLNLAANARDAMPDGGKLLIETRSEQVRDEELKQHPELKKGDYAMLAVSDTGTGVDPEIRARIFEPFFTTKSATKSVGLGLSTASGIVTQSGGLMWLSGQPEKGARFEIWLPAVDGKMARPIELESSSSKTTNGTVLVVEDTRIVREAICAVLEPLGYKLLVARNGQEAIAMARQHEGVIDLLLTDVVMPGMSGGELAEQLGKLRGEMKLLYMSGYANDDRAVTRAVADNGVEFIKKPFRPSELAGAVRRALDGVEPAKRPI